MEPIFNDLYYNSNNGVLSDCELLKNATNLYFLHPKNRTIEYHFYHFGLIFDSRHYEKKAKWRDNMFTPTRDIFKGVIETEVIVSVQLGKDLYNEYDESEADKYDTYYWKIMRAIEYKRPDWAFYMFIGNLQGILNGNRMTQDKFIQYLNLFPKTFIDQHSDRLSYIFNYFDERGYLLSLQNEIKLIKLGHGIFDDELNLKVN